jgi:Ca2+-binding RTX toxin-like protein
MLRLPTQGTLVLSNDGSFTFTPAPNFKGQVKFQYTLSDGEFSHEALVTINVTNIALDAAGNLQVGGSTDADRIIIQTAMGGKLSVRFNNASSASFTVNAPNKVIVHGNAGNDTISVSSDIGVPVVFYGDAGNDYLSGGSYNDILDGGAGDDRLLSGAADDFLYGGPGNDTLAGGLGTDYAYGDSYLDSNGNPQLPAPAQQGKDLLSGAGGNDFLFGQGGNDTLNGGQGSDLMRGGDGNDIMSGDDGDDTLSGDLGADKLYGRAGTVIAQDASTHDLVPRSISFKGASQTLEAFQPMMERVAHCGARRLSL